MTESQNNQPQGKARLGLIEITKWENGFTFQKSYKDKEGNWKNTQSFQAGDLASIKELCSEMIRREAKQ